MNRKSELAVFNASFHPQKKNTNSSIYNSSRTSKVRHTRTMYQHRRANSNCISKCLSSPTLKKCQIEKMTKTHLFDFHIHKKLCRVKQWYNYLNNLMFNCVISTP
ncbi:unnamed protein product [Adineta ricciae]|uniref:Uncharacterized protein n=1 Tax=Adineta ricciae TaxID=249248 RepID=A0A814EPC4_ADIRI|nr:unnamed protein product [Adineta ricciae]